MTAPQAMKAAGDFVGDHPWQALVWVALCTVTGNATWKLACLVTERLWNAAKRSVDPTTGEKK